MNTVVETAQPQVIVDQVRTRTSRQIRDLRVECRGSRVVVRGVTSSYYIKQLAQQELIERLPPGTRLENAIIVAN